MSNWMDRVRISGAKGIALLVVVTLVLTGCGGLGEDDDPTPTPEAVDALPTVEEDAINDAIPDEDATPTIPPNTDVSTEGDLATPVAQEPGGTPDPAVQATPDLLGEPATPDTPDATPEDTQEVADNGIVGDGTSGAVPANDIQAPVDEPEDVVEEATPDSPDAGTPVAFDDPVSVDSCSPDVIPPFAGELTTFTLTAELNFRTGPGSDCDLIGTGPLSQGSQVEVVSGAVIREGEEDLEWVQVEVEGQSGWVAADFLEPAE